MMYAGYQLQSDLLGPALWAARSTAHWLGIGPRALRIAAAWLETCALTRVRHRRPEFGIERVSQDGHDVDVSELPHAHTPFCTLLHFRKDTSRPGPRVLLVAPMSGHFSTLLRDTVRTLLGDHDVYLTDWHNARDVPLREGPFGVDEYVAHLIDFLRVLGPGTHLMAVCQPCVQALAATALLAEEHDPATPSSLVLMAGPIDCRIRPTGVNRLANERPIEWFERSLVDVVPPRLPGAGREVYPGYVQLAAFVSMNGERHQGMFLAYFKALSDGDTARADAIRDFYREYCSVSDLPAEFYLETVRRVFQQHELARGRWMWRGRALRPAAIRRTALMTVEGERDDICAFGQTLAAQDLCPNIPPFLRSHWLQPGVGHYGVFSGKRWQQRIYPMVRSLIHAAD